MLHTTIGLVPMRRCTKGMLECPAEMPWAQTNELRQRRKRYPLFEMFLNIGSDDPLLPGCKATSDLRLNAG